MRPIIDSHLDLAWNALSWKRDLTLPLAELNVRDKRHGDDPARGRATTSLPEMRRGGFAVCLATLMARVPHQLGNGAIFSATLDYPAQGVAYAAAQGQLAYYRHLAECGEVSLIRTSSELDRHWEQWNHRVADQWSQLPVGIVVAMEGCDAIVSDRQVESWYRDGLRCVSLVHYGRSAYAVGTGDDGPLTPRGRDLLREFERVGMILDVTHLSDTSFFEAFDRYHGPLLASHNNCRALVPGGRQFSDEQIRLIIERGGIIGAACDAWMLYPGWIRHQTTRDVVSIDAIADHIDHVCQLAGNCRHAAIGTDLDGGYGTEQTPTGLDTIADVRKLEGILSARGYAEEDLDAIFYRNWLTFLRQHLRESN